MKVRELFTTIRTEGGSCLLICYSALSTETKSSQGWMRHPTISSWANISTNSSAKAGIASWAPGRLSALSLSRFLRGTQEPLSPANAGY